MQALIDLEGGLARVAVMALPQRPLNLLDRSDHRGIWGGIRLQKDQRRRLRELTKQLQGHRVIGFEAGCELIDQAGLTLDQIVLIAGQYASVLR